MPKESMSEITPLEILHELERRIEDLKRRKAAERTKPARDALSGAIAFGEEFRRWLAKQINS